MMMVWVHDVMIGVGGTTHERDTGLNRRDGWIRIVFLGLEVVVDMPTVVNCIIFKFPCSWVV